MAEKLTERGYAAHRGCARSTVQQARRSGRLRRSVSVDEQGRIWIDAIAADREWERRTRVDLAPRTGPTAPRPRLGSAPPPAAVAELEGRLGELVAAEYDETKRRALALIPPLIAGAAEEIRTGGRDASAEALAAALRLDDPTDDDMGIEALTAVSEIAERGSADPAGAARAEGREIASGRWWRRQEGSGDVD